MTDHCAYIVQAECLHVVQQLLSVVSLGCISSLADRTVVRRRSVVIHERAADVSITTVILVDTTVYCECQTIHDVEVSVTATSERTTLSTRVTILVREDSVTTYTACTVQIVALSEVVHLFTPLVDHDLLVSATEVYWIYRSLSLDDRPDCTRTDCTFRYLSVVVVSVAHVYTYLQPLLCLVVSLQTSSQTSFSCTFLDTFLIQVTQRSVVVDAVRSARYACIVFLTETVHQTFLFPVVSLQPKLSTVKVVHSTHCSLRVHHTAFEDEILTSRNCINHVTRAKA